MGVPKTFISKYNPDQFELIGRDMDLTRDGKCLSIKGKNVFARIIIKHKRRQK